MVPRTNEIVKELLLQADIDNTSISPHLETPQEVSSSAILPLSSSAVAATISTSIKESEDELAHNSNANKISTKDASKRTIKTAAIFKSPPTQPQISSQGCSRVFIVKSMYILLFNN